MVIALIKLLYQFIYNQTSLGFSVDMPVFDHCLLSSRVGCCSCCGSFCGCRTGSSGSCLCAASCGRRSTSGKCKHLTSHNKGSQFLHVVFHLVLLNEYNFHEKASAPALYRDSLYTARTEIPFPSPYFTGMPLFLQSAMRLIDI